ncbi:uncharacterized protein [Argopecten irradians]|uniref:uncharacterized protein n=1 Tax=Argopecten irradians TaxID=31199 RepID=UPI0037135076
MGLWYGNEKPDMKLFLGSMLTEMKDLFKGETVQVNNNAVNLRAIILSTVADAPARCMMLDFVQFNGNFGCPCCYTKGETFYISEKGNSHIYPYDLTEDHIANGHATIRTDEETLTFARNVEKKFIEGKRREPEPEKGVKGISMLSVFPTFSLIRGTTIDYMHCVLLGIMKMMIGLWINQDHRQEAWSIRASIDSINERIRCVRPPHLISRMPQNIDDYGDWKASEFRTFLLFYSVPVLNDILPTDYFSHYVNLVVGVYHLLKVSISGEDILSAKRSLQRFVGGVEKLYGERYSTFNVHSLLHLTQKIEDLGPLWAHSCFFYEGLNGDLRNQFHGTQQIEQQILTAVCIQQKIPELEDTLQEGPIRTFYNNLTKSKRANYKDHELGPCTNTFQLGASHLYVPNETESLAIQECFGRVFEVRKMYRVLHKGHVLHI